MAASAAVEKQNQLVSAIVKGVEDKLAANLSELAKTLATISVNINSIQQRLEALESIQNTGAGAKRAVRTGAAKGGAAKKGAKAAGSDISKITNGRLYCRYIMLNDTDGAREKWGTEDNIATALAKNKTVQGKTADDSPEYWAAIGTALWDNCFDDTQKAAIKEEFKTWKADAERAEEGGALQEDTNGVDDDDATA
jgi:hypothetical protein